MRSMKRGEESGGSSMWKRWLPQEQSEEPNPGTGRPVRSKSPGRVRVRRRSWTDGDGDGAVAAFRRKSMCQWKVFPKPQVPFDPPGEAALRGTGVDVMPLLEGNVPELSHGERNPPVEAEKKQVASPSFASRRIRSQGMTSPGPPGRGEVFVPPGRHGLEADFVPHGEKGFGEIRVGVVVGRKKRARGHWTKKRTPQSFPFPAIRDRASRCRLPRAVTASGNLAIPAPKRVHDCTSR
jgi:hypothetical protein